MYNLLVIQGQDKDEWQRNQGRMYERDNFLERVFQRTDEAISNQFKKASGEPDFGALVKLPCLFTYEESRVPAYIGWIIKVEVHRRSLRIEYYIPDVYPRLELDSQRVFDALGLGNMRPIGTTHWAVKDIDLFEAIVRLFYTSGK